MLCVSARSNGQNLARGQLSRAFVGSTTDARVASMVQSIGEGTGIGGIDHAGASRRPAAAVPARPMSARCLHFLLNLVWRLRRSNRFYGGGIFGADRGCMGPDDTGIAIVAISENPRGIIIDIPIATTTTVATKNSIPSRSLGTSSSALGRSRLGRLMSAIDHLPLIVLQAPAITARQEICSKFAFGIDSSRQCKRAEQTKSDRSIRRVLWGYPLVTVLLRRV
jgi:hypothetical protein